MRLKILLNDNVEEFQFAVHGELKDWREHHTTACSRFGRSTALSQIAFATLRQLRLHAERYMPFARQLYGGAAIRGGLKN